MNKADGRCCAHGVNVTAHEIQQAAAAIAAITHTPALRNAKSGVSAKDRALPRPGLVGITQEHIHL